MSHYDLILGQVLGYDLINVTPQEKEMVGGNEITPQKKEMAGRHEITHQKKGMAGGHEIPVQCDIPNEDGITPQHIHEVMCWSRAIYRVLGVALEHGRLEDIYIPGYNLFQMHPKYFQHKDLAVRYVASLERILSTDEQATHYDMTSVELAVGRCSQLIRGQVKSATAATTTSTSSIN